MPMTAKTETREHPRWLSDEEQAAWRGLFLMYAQITLSLNRQLSDSDLSVQDYGVLVHLSEAPAGRCRPFELGEALGLEKTRLSHHLKRLEERGLVARTRCQTDHRGWLVSITATGREALKSAAPGHVAAVRDSFIDRLSPQQIEAMTDIASAVLTSLGASDGEGSGEG
jgi:DNA-binding MarR family transcriptional regulator